MTNIIASQHKKTLAFGIWPSAISSELISSDSIAIDQPTLTQDAVYFIERRPMEGGRCVIVRASAGKNIDILPAPYSARSRVHEYGGGCYCINHKQVYFINDSDQDIYCIAESEITRITNTDNKKFADFIYDRKFKRLIAVCETYDNNLTTNAIVSIDIDSGEIRSLEQGDDFYASPRLNTDASQLCWQSWNHPNMPWDGNRLWSAALDDKGGIGDKKLIAGADNISVFQPQWSPDNKLYFISDESGWWHLYRHHDSAMENTNEQLTQGDKEFGLPQWVFAQSTYAFISSSEIVCCFASEGKTRLATLTLNEQNRLSHITTPWQAFSAITACNNRICFIAASSQQFPQLVTASVNRGNSATLSSDIIKTSCQLAVTAEHYSAAQTVKFLNRHKQTVYANYYPPCNPDYQAESNTLPPLIVICHGGPTGQSSIALDPKKQFWTSRGFALLDVNYSGSTGYGRAYRSRLHGLWGKLDVQDCCDAALYAVQQGLADENRLIIRGSSAGGFTVLAALTFEQVFSAGASYYGISELSSLAGDAHKFESQYLNRLIGPYPQAEVLYSERSPINHTEQLNCPVIFFQGIEDKVVPKAQSEKMFNALDKKGITVAAQYYAGEQHGFRKAQTIIQSLENELSFYQLVFNMKAKSEIDFCGDIQLKNT